MDPGGDVDWSFWVGDRSSSDAETCPRSRASIHAGELRTGSRPRRAAAVLSSKYRWHLSSSATRAARFRADSSSSSESISSDSAGIGMGVRGAGRELASTSMVQSASSAARASSTSSASSASFPRYGEGVRGSSSTNPPTGSRAPSSARRVGRDRSRMPLSGVPNADARGGSASRTSGKFILSNRAAESKGHSTRRRSRARRMATIASRLGASRSDRPRERGRRRISERTLQINGQVLIPFSPVRP